MNALLLLTLVTASEAECRDGVLRAHLFGRTVAVDGASFYLEGPPDEAPVAAIAAATGAEIESTADVYRGVDADGSPVELTLGLQWQLTAQDVSRPLTLPRGLRELETAEVLGRVDDTVWITYAGGLVSVDLTTLQTQIRRWSSERATRLHAEPDTLWITIGRRVYGCTAHSCDERGRWPVVMTELLRGPGGWLGHGNSRQAGLYRIPDAAPQTAELLLSGRVIAFCSPEEGEVWAMMTRDDDLRLVAASTRTPALQIYTRAEVLGTAMLASPLPDEELVVETLAALSDAGWAHIELLALRAMGDARKPVRSAAARAMGKLDSSRSTTALWLTSRDRALEVRHVAFDVARERCDRVGEEQCVALLDAFTADSEADIAWTARDILLDHDVERALEGASRDYKIDLLSLLVERLERDGPSARAALEALVRDDDPEVRQRALSVVNLSTP